MGVYGVGSIVSAAVPDDPEAMRELIGHLQDALGTARVIGAAIGIFMATQKVTYDQAFAVLCQASQNRNQKLRDVAENVLFIGALPDPRSS